LALAGGLRQKFLVAFDVKSYESGCVFFFFHFLQYIYAFCRFRDNGRAVGSEMKWHCPGEHVYFAFLGEASVLVSRVRDSTTAQYTVLLFLGFEETFCLFFLFLSPFHSTW
jgi:hypothetical protein